MSFPAAKTQGHRAFISFLRTFASSWLVVLFCLTGCGFSPLYAAKTQNAAALDQIHIGNIPDSEGQYLRNALMDRFYGSGRPAAPLYKLSVSRIEERQSDLDITKSSDATRAQLRLTAKMTLRDAAGAALLERGLTSITSYNILQSQFTTRVSEDNARRNALDDLARQIEAQLALYFNRS